MDEQRAIDIRCFCSRSPLLARAGRDDSGRPYVHLKVFKQRRLYGEMVATSGVVSLRCRECFRWHRVTIRQEVAVTQEPLPDRIPVP
jgi:hypothetical protein